MSNVKLTVDKLAALVADKDVVPLVGAVLVAEVALDRSGRLAISWSSAHPLYDYVLYVEPVDAERAQLLRDEKGREYIRLRGLMDHGAADEVDLYFARWADVSAMLEEVHAG